ncbi:MULTISPECIES: SGNH/GDSL hydrolase family protein [Arthrobacter]|uniref:SGNH/GDSL hydrolase family protein n=1 Tax=Arthrobacter sunyaminii TaxID=2816859 RepID=A0A975PDW8_9MICC|nr:MULTISPECIES: SGNH/GDSL hydrolase family protein [Arthrobacter]MBO0897593.1 SGNH/GDSL hydrolase family protein [Arthrobacter sunyaminii]MBO0908485.1 SGNH/GDSL hydrolase family protein [Arthrobacter sunyaminii]QWQ35970.1 SGNH/GDSL hydrolase family protein [Arthrobacter sunyaminii]
MTFTSRYVALGDSFTEGVGDWDDSLPNGVRGWADRVAEQLILAEDSWGYANLAIRGKKLHQVLAEQVDAAIALEPTLVSIYAGGNDILRPRVDIDTLMDSYDGAIAKLRASGAAVLMFTGFDSGRSPVFGATRGRTALYNELVREVADRHGAELVDYWRMKELQDERYWDIDRLHMAPAGHMFTAKKVLEVLRRTDTIDVPELDELPARTRAEQLRRDAQWAREYLGPWVGRRLRGVSSGDNLTPKYPIPVHPKVPVRS